MECVCIIFLILKTDLATENGKSFFGCSSFLVLYWVQWIVLENSLLVPKKKNCIVCATLLYGRLENNLVGLYHDDALQRAIKV